MSNQVPKLLKVLIRNAPRGAIIAYISLLKGTKPKKRFYEATSVGIKQLYRQARVDDEKGRNCYVQCTLLKRRPVKGRGTKEYVAGTSDLYVDIDRPEPYEGPVEPTVAVQSGNGWHLHFALDRFLLDVGEIERLNQGLAAAFKADDCWDACRLLRIPGTRNHKDPANPKPVTERFQRRQYTPASIDALLGTIDLTKARVEVPDTEPQELPGAEPIGDEDLIKLPDGLRKKLCTAHEGKDRSSSDFHLCMLLARYWSIGKIHTALLRPDWSLSSKTLAGNRINETYLRNTLKRVARHIAESGAAKDPDPPILAKLIYDKRRSPDGKLLVGQPDSDWCRPCVTHLQTRFGITFRRAADDPDKGYVGTPNGLIDTSSRRFEDWLQDITGFTRESRIHATLKAWLQSEARRRSSTPVKLRPWLNFEFDGVPKVTTLADVEGDKILEVTLQKKPKAVVYPNGGKEALLRTSHRLKRALPSDRPAKVTLETLRELFTDVLACSDVSREILTAYLLAAPLTRGFGIVTLPLLYLTGAAGNGKTQTMKLISTYFHGTYKVLGESTVASMYRGAAAEIFIPFDDYDKLSDPVKQFILSTTTGAERQKADGRDAIISQDLHVLLAFTSTKELVDEPLRRRALRVEINKSRWHGKEHFSEEHWKKINGARDAIWWAWFDVLSRAPIGELVREFDERVQRAEKLITVDANRPLAGFLTLLYEVLKIAAPHLKMSVSPLERWLEELQLCDISEVYDRHELSGALELLFERALSNRFFTEQLQGPLYETAPRKGRLNDHMDEGFSLDYTYNHKEWLILSGTTSQWWSTLQFVTRGGYRRPSAVGVGHDFKALIGETPRHKPGSKRSKVYAVSRYRITHITNAGRARTSRGWKVAIKVPQSRLPAGESYEHQDV